MLLWHFRASVLVLPVYVIYIKLLQKGSTHLKVQYLLSGKYNNNDNNEHSCICKSENTQKIDCCYTGASIPKTDCCHTGENILDTDFGYTLSLINGKYKLIIIYWLANHKSVMRYNELKRCL